MPPLPEAFAHVSTDPATEVLYVPLPFGQLEVIPPPFDVALPLLPQLLTSLALARVPELVDAFLESLNRSVPYLYRPFLVDPEPQESTLLGRSCSTLGWLTSSFNSFPNHLTTLSRMRSAERWLEAKMAMSSA